MAVRHSIDLNELLEGSWMEQARQRARIRLIDSIQSKEGVQVAGGDIHTEEGRLVEAFSFYYARLVMCVRARTSGSSLVGHRQRPHVPSNC